MTESRESDAALPPFIWATRGRAWGFRFLRDGGLADPLPAYEAAFSGLEGSREVCREVGADVVVRLRDPEARRDRAGRRIAHDFVIRGGARHPLDCSALAAAVWAAVSADYAAGYAQPA